MKIYTKKALALLTALIIIICLVPTVSAEDDLHLLYGRTSLSFMSRGDIYTEAYDRIVAGVEERLAEIPLTDLNMNEAELEWVVTAYRNDPNGHFWNIDSYNYGVYPSGQVASYVPIYNALGLASDADFKHYRQSFDDACNNLIKKSNISAFSNDYTKAKNLHDTLIKHNNYSYTENAHNEYGAIVEGASVCQGYTLSYQYLLRLAGVMAYSITGMAGGEGHSWNLVRIDGDYYQTDVTWDDANRGESNDSEIYYAYFNVTSAAMSNDHYWTVPVYSLPLCTATKANYYEKNPHLIFSSSTTAQGMADLIKNGFARVYLQSGTVNSFSGWFSENYYDILSLCGYDMTQDISVNLSAKDKEVHLFIDGVLNDPFAHVIIGDVNGDGSLSAIDSNIIKRIISGMVTATEEQMVAGDIDGDNTVTGIDSNLLKRMIAGT